MSQVAPRAGLLEGKVAVVTGAARGIGRAAAIALAREGADIAGVDVCAPVDPRSGVKPSTPEDLEETGRLIREAGRRWLGIELDQRDLPALRSAAARCEQELGGIDILFANAGIQSFHSLLEMEDADWHITIDVNLTGTASYCPGIRPVHGQTWRWPHRPDFLHPGPARNEVRSSVFGIEVGHCRPNEVSSVGARPAQDHRERPHSRPHRPPRPVIKSAMRRCLKTPAGSRPEQPRTSKRRARYSPPRHRWACPRSSPRMSHPWSSFSLRRPDGWPQARPLRSPAATAPTHGVIGEGCMGVTWNLMRSTVS